MEEKKEPLVRRIWSKPNTVGQLILSWIIISCSSDDPGLQATNELRLTDIQVIGSHNSYKLAVEQPILDFVTQLNRGLAESIEYEHIPIKDQLDLGLRNLEFDVFYDPQVGHYQNPRGLDIIRQTGFTPLPYDEDSVLSTPGLKMFHTQDVDFRSHHLLFKDGLKELQRWSAENPSHTPIAVLINAKDAAIPLTGNPIPFDIRGMKSIDDEIRSVFAEKQLITPDGVRGDFPTLESAILSNGWPLLEDSRGKVLFVLDEGQSKTDLYLLSFPQLSNAALFVNVPEGRAESGFRIINDPINNLSEIQRLVGLGYMVRTRADSETVEARANVTARFEAAIASGAQVISTDYYLPSNLFESPYQVIFEDGSYERLR